MRIALFQSFCGLSDVIQAQCRLGDVEELILRAKIQLGHVLGPLHDGSHLRRLTGRTDDLDVVAVADQNNLIALGGIALYR